MDNLVCKRCKKCKRKAIAFESDFEKKNINRINFLDGNATCCEGGCDFDNENITSISTVMCQSGFMCGDVILDSVKDLQEISSYDMEKESDIKEANNFHNTFNQLDQ